MYAEKRERRILSSRKEIDPTEYAWIEHLHTGDNKLRQIIILKTTLRSVRCKKTERTRFRSPASAMSKRRTIFSPGCWRRCSSMVNVMNRFTLSLFSSPLTNARRTKCTERKRKSRREATINFLRTDSMLKSILISKEKAVTIDQSRWKFAR